MAYVLAASRARRLVSPYELHAEKLRLAHLVLRRNIRRIQEAASAERLVPGVDLADYVALFLRFLTLHHENEDRFLFPTLWANAPRRTTDAAELDRFGKEHEHVHALIDAIGAELPALRRGGADAYRSLARRIADLEAMIVPHLDAEELVLAPARLAEMIPADALMRCEAMIVEEDRSRGGKDVLMLLVHSLDVAERRTLLGKQPWFVERVLIRGLWKAGFERFLPFAHALP